MNIVNQLTLRHLKANKKRTAVTVIGIILSVSMVTAVFTSAISFLTFMREVEIAYGGNWHTAYVLCSADDVKTLNGSEGVAGVAVEQLGTRVDVDLKNVSPKTQTDLCGVNEAFYDYFGITLTQGKYPAKTGEIVAAQSFIDENRLDWQVGDTITVSVWNADKKAYVSKQYVLTGITGADNRQTRSSALMTVLTTGKEHDLTAYVLNHKLNNSIWDRSMAQAQSIGKIDADAYHSDLLAYSGIIRDNDVLLAIGGFGAVILIIIIIASVLMIYNSFAISFRQRSRYLGMLASVGATRRQKRRSVYFEGLLLGAVGIPLGLLAGIGGIAVTFRFVSDAILSAFAIPVDRPLSVSVNWLIVVCSISVSVLTIFISALIPARRASKTSAIDAIRQAGEVKVKSGKLKASKLLGKLFGYEGQLAVKNYKRNGRRSRMITFALGLSVLLFLTAAYFSTTFSRLMGTEFSAAAADVYISCAARDSKTVEKKLLAMAAVQNVSSSAVGDITLKNSDQMLSEEAKAYKSEYNFSDIVVFAMRKKDFQAYCKELSVDADGYRNASPPQVILVNRTLMRGVSDKKKVAVTPYAHISGKQVEFTFGEDGSADRKSGSAVVSAITDKHASDDAANIQSAYFVMPLDSFLTVFRGGNAQITYAIKTGDHAAVYAELSEYLSDDAISYYSYDAVKQQASIKAVMAVVNVFVYGFITLITLIGAANIINTISTGMEERRREFAMIKSVGLTPKGFKKMVYLESAYYGYKALVFSIPLSLAVNYLMYKLLANEYDFGFSVDPAYYIAAVAAVFFIIGAALLYATAKIKKDNIVETLKNEDT